MVVNILNSIKNQPKNQIWARIVALILFIFLVIFNLYNVSFWRQHASLGFDIDYSTGSVMEVFYGSDNHEILTLNDQIVTVNGKPAAEFQPQQDLQIDQLATFEVSSGDGTLRTVSLYARVPSGLFLWEHCIYPFMGLAIFSFGMVLILLMPVNRVNISFAVFMFFSALLFIFFNLSRYIEGVTNFIFQISMVLVVMASVEFHWHFLNIRIVPIVLKIQRIINSFVVLFLFILYVITSTHIPAVFLYAYWMVSFLFIIFLFTIQYVYDELSRGMLRILLLTFFASLGPLVYFVLIPLTMGYPRSMPILISVLPILLLPLNYSLLIQRKKQYARINCAVISFVLTLLVTYFLVEVSSEIINAWNPGLLILGRNWLSYLIMIFLIGTGIIIYHFASHFVKMFVYGDASSEAKQMQQLSIDLHQMEDTSAILIQTAQVFQKFFDFSYLQVSLQDGTVLRFEGQEQSVSRSVDRFAVMSVLNRITLRAAQSQSRQINTFIDLETIRDLLLEYEQIFGDTPEYCFLLEGRGYPVGVISAGPRRNGERFDGLETQQLEALLSQYQAIVENLFLMDEVEKRSQQVRKMGQQLLEAREDERKRIARDMHDNIIQSLTAFRYTMNDLYDKDKLTISDDEADELQHTLQVISQDIRDICFNLRPPALDATGFRSAVVSIVESHHRNNHLQINLDISDSPVIDQFTDMVSICLYRVLQEALVNISKYARTDTVWVTMNANEEFVQLTVEDNGIGFKVPERLSDLVTEGHFGLTGIQEFLEIVNGVLTIRSRIKEGTTLLARIPLVKVEGEHDLYYDYRR